MRNQELENATIWLNELEERSQRMSVEKKDTGRHDSIVHYIFQRSPDNDTRNTPVRISHR